MANALSAANLVVSRAGAGSISEFALLGKAVILVPSPNVSEDHQTKNAMALVEKGAAEIVKDSEAVERGMKEAVALAMDRDRLESLSANIANLAIVDSADRVVAEIENIIEKHL
jgi:UDP-N-acetylglucosamine--N-acetylmuramyl-(pentapeptide) pyrophosphoryl-undecaprenol N-acetylglucosamine transferase